MCLNSWLILDKEFFSKNSFSLEEDNSDNGNTSQDEGFSWYVKRDAFKCPRASKIDFNEGYGFANKRLRVFENLNVSKLLSLLLYKVFENSQKYLEILGIIYVAVWFILFHSTSPSMGYSMSFPIIICSM